MGRAVPCVQNLIDFPIFAPRCGYQEKTWADGNSNLGSLLRFYYPAKACRKVPILSRTLSAFRHFTKTSKQSHITTMATQLIELPEVERLSPLVIRVLAGNPGKA